MAGVDIVLAAAPTAELEALVGALNDELADVYAPEQRHGLAVQAIFQPQIRFFLAWRDGVPLGCDGFAEVKRMYVRPEARGHGIADAIMARLVEESAAAGFRLLRLETGVHQQAAIGFYRRQGFGPCAAFPPYTAMPPASIITSVFMEKTVG